MMNRSLPGCLLIAFLVMSVSNLSFADERAEVQKKIEKLLERFPVEARFDQPYAGNDNPYQMLDLYLPKSRKTDKPLPVIVFIHGGAWIGGDRTGGAGRVISYAATGEYIGVSVGYRLSHEAKWPAQIYDCKAAIRWLRGNADKLGLDPDHIGVWGTSAGGHLVSLLGTTGDVKELEGDLGPYTNQSSRVTCVVDECGPTDFELPLTYKDGVAQIDDEAVVGLIGGKLSDHPDLVKASSPITYVTSDDAPILILHGTKDQRVDFAHAEHFDKALDQAGVPCLLVPITDAGHGLGHPLMNDRISNFFARYLQDKTVDIPEEALGATSSR